MKANLSMKLPWWADAYLYLACIWAVIRGKEPGYEKIASRIVGGAKFNTVVVPEDGE